MASAVKCLRTVALSAVMVPESSEQKGDANDGMSSGEENCLYCQLLLVLAIQSTTVIELIPLEFINFNRNNIHLPREAFSLSKVKTLCNEQMQRNSICLYFIFIVPFVHLLTFKVFIHSYFNLFITSTLKIQNVYIVFYLGFFSSSRLVLFNRKFGN